jgi:hypothetical protein
MYRTRRWTAIRASTYGSTQYARAGAWHPATVRKLAYSSSPLAFFSQRPVPGLALDADSLARRSRYMATDELHRQRARRRGKRPQPRATRPCVARGASDAEEVAGPGGKPDRLGKPSDAHNHISPRWRHSPHAARAADFHHSGFWNFPISLTRPPVRLTGARLRTVCGVVIDNRQQAMSGSSGTRPVRPLSIPEIQPSSVRTRSPAPLPCRGRPST